MALSQSPRKVVPLALEDEHVPRPKPRSAGSNVTRRVFFCGVVVEGTEGGRELPDDVKDLIASLGESMDMVPSPTQTSPSQQNTDMQTATRRRAMTNTSALADIVKELVATERNYVQKLHILKTEYADPLRKFSKDKNTAIIGAYQANTLFGNIDNLLPVNAAFLADLEEMEREGNLRVGDVALKHFKHLKGFENYRLYYAKHEEVQKIFEETVKSNASFAGYIDRIKYSTAADSRKNKFGLRELIAEPWQRIPRYTLLFNTMLKHMAMNHPQRRPLEEAIQYASIIARAETDAETKRMAIMHCLSTSMDGFPVSLVSNSRHFIDCIDVRDVIAPDSYSPVSSSGPLGVVTLNCTLFLFNDKLVIVKRPSEKSGRALAGLDQLDRVVKGGLLPSSMRKSGLVCKGVLDITDVTATDVGGADIHIFLENPMSEQSERWAGRQFRALSVVFPTSLASPDRLDNEKQRFLHNLWTAQARFRTRQERSIVLRAEEREVENRGGYVTCAQTYFNIYTRINFLQEPKKTKIVMHIDQDGAADPIPFGDTEGPYVVVRVQPMAGELSRYNVTSSYEDEPEEDIIKTSRIPERIVSTIHQYGLFKFKTGVSSSRPTTPTASRSRAAIFGLDVISRNLFGSRPSSGIGMDFFAGSMNGHRRSRTTDSRNSTLTLAGTSSSGSSLTRLSRSSTASAAMGAANMDDEPSSSWSKGSRNSRTRSLSRGAKKLVKRAKSPFRSERDPGSDSDSPGPSTSRSYEKEKDSYKRTRSLSQGHMNMQVEDSERDLAMRLELARRNSQNQSAHDYESAIEKPMEETIYEDEPPPSLRPRSRLSHMSRAPSEPPQDRDYESVRSTTPTFRPQSPLLTSPDRERLGRSLSRHSSERSDRRPMGPRSPSPLPIVSPNTAPTTLPSVDSDMERTLVNAPLPVTPTRPVYPRTPIPRSKRQPFNPTSVLNTDTTPKANSESAAAEVTKPPSIVEPLAIKKRSSVRTNASVSTLGSGSPGSAGRKPQMARRFSPIGKSAFANTSTRRVSGQRSAKPLTGGGEAEVDLDELEKKVKRAAEATKLDIESSHRAVKRIRLETQKAATSSPVRAAAAQWETSPVKRVAPRPASPALTKEAQARREEMLQAIGRRGTEAAGPPRPRVLTMFENSSSSSSVSLLSNGSPHSSGTDDAARTIDALAEEADQGLAKALQSQENVTSEIQVVMQLLRQRTDELVKTGLGVQSWKRQYEVVSQLLSNSQQEVNELYQYFNEELDGMFDAASLPDDDAWAAMTKKVKEAQQGKIKAEQENSHLKARISELEIQQQQWLALLREHRLVPDD